MSFFICKESVGKGSKNHVGLNLEAISMFVFTPGDAPAITVKFQDETNTTISGEDAIGLLRAMKLNPPLKPAVTHSDPPEDYSCPAKADSGMGLFGCDDFRQCDYRKNCIPQPEPTYPDSGCPLGEGDLFCNDATACDRFNDCCDHAAAIDEGLLDEEEPSYYGGADIL